MKAVFSTCLLLLAISVLGQKQEYSIVFLNKRTDLPAMPKEDVDKLMKGHMANMGRLAKEGKLLAAGPFDGGGGLFILNTASADEAREWISTDPGVKAERWRVEILPYLPRSGGICPVGEPYQMVDYAFVRFDAVVSKFSSESYPEILARHEEHVRKLMATGNVITYAVFSERDGGILVMKGEVESDVFQSDPAVQEGLIELDIRKLYIAKGSFCEQ